MDRYETLRKYYSGEIQSADLEILSEILQKEKEIISAEIPLPLQSELERVLKSYSEQLGKLKEVGKVEAIPERYPVPGMSKDSKRVYALGSIKFCLKEQNVSEQLSQIINSILERGYVVKIFYANEGKMLFPKERHFKSIENIEKRVLEELI